MIINYIGGETWVQSLRCLKPDGRMLTCGATAGFSPPTDIRYIWTYEQNIIGSNGWTLEEQATVLDMADKKTLTPVIHAVRPLNQIAHSIQELIDRLIVGKIIIRPQE